MTCGQQARSIVSTSPRTRKGRKALRSPPSGFYRRQVEALVSDVQFRNSVRGLRGLGRAGIPAIAFGPTRGAAGLHSRFAARAEIGPDSALDARGFADRIGTLAVECGGLVVYAGTERSLDALFAARGELPDEVILPYPDSSVLDAVRDKRRLEQLATAAGLAAPRTLAVGSPADFLREPPPVPSAIKLANTDASLGSTRIVRSERELNELMEWLPPESSLLAQELASGPLAAVALVIGRDGRVVARFQQVADRQWPEDVGVSALARSVAPDEDLLDRCAQMLSSAGYWGLAHLQFLSTPDGPALIDINPRFYGSMPLALAAGVNLPAAVHAVTLGRPFPPALDYRIGVEYRWLQADLE